MNVKELVEAIERAAKGAAERMAKDPAMQVVVIFTVRDFVEAAAVGILRSRSPEGDGDPRGILLHLGDMMWSFERGLIEHMMREEKLSAEGGEFSLPSVFFGTPLRAVEVAGVILREVTHFRAFGQGRDGFDTEAVFQNVAVYLRELARERADLREHSKSS